MYKKYALSSMALLGLTRAQLWVERSKTFTVHSVTPMNRLLTLVDSGNDDVVVRLECVVDDDQDPEGVPEGTVEIGPYDSYFNDITRDEIGERFCPAADASSPNKHSANEGPAWKSACDGALMDMPVYDNGGLPWSEPAGGLTCQPDHQLDITIFNRYEESISMTYNLDTWQYSCIEDDFLSIFFGFGKREFFESKDLCFANEEYVPENLDPPFVVNNNCYGPRWDEWPQPPSDKPASPEWGNPHDYWECHTKGYRVDLHVLDNPDANELWLPDGSEDGVEKRNWRKLREPYMWVQVDFHRVKDYFQIFPEDKARISFWKGTDLNPRSVTVSPAEDMDHICDPWRAADEIVCENLSVFCTEPDDKVNLRIAAAGEVLIFADEYEECEEDLDEGCVPWYAAISCSDIVAGAFDYSAMQAALTDDWETYAAYQDQEFLYPVAANDREEGADVNVWFSFKLGTYYRSNEEICFTGDFFPYQSPSCYLKNSGLPIATQIHNPHEYAMDRFVQQIVVNMDYDRYQTLMMEYESWSETLPEINADENTEVYLTN
jgi:hypothetical protein